MPNYLDSTTKLLKELDKAKPLRKAELILSTALVSVGTTAMVLIGRDKLLSLINHLDDRALTLVESLGFALFIVTIILGVLHIVTALLEINWIERFYESVMPSPPRGAVLIAIFIGCLMVILAYLSGNIRAYSAVYLVFLVFDIVGMSMLSNAVDKSLIPHEKNGSDIRPDMLFEIRLFYVGRRWKLLGLFRLFGTIAAVICARLQIEVPAYILILGMIVINETFAWSWRIRMYRRHGYVFV